MRERLSSAVAPPEAPERARPELAAACGDMLLTFDGAAAAAPRRFPDQGEWRPSGGLWLAPTGRSWKGYPLRTFSSGPWDFWLIGEVVAPRGEEPETLLAEIAGGRRSAEALNGHLLLLAWSASERQWHVWTDRFGTVHAYVGSDGSRVALGTCFKSVAAAASRRRLDWPALAGFLSCGFFPADRTFFDDVRVLRPATHAVFTVSGAPVREERYWTWEHRPHRTRSHEDTVAEFADTLHRVLDDETAIGRIAVPISGGLDSRTTFAALTRDRSDRRERLWSYSYGYSDDSAETRIARRVAQARGVPIETLVIGRYLFDRLPAILACVEGFQDVTQARQAAVTPLLAERSDAVIAAHWGDVWLDDMGLSGEDTPPADVAAHAFKKVAKRGREWLLREIVAPRIPGEDPAKIAQGFVGRELERLDGIADPDFRVKAFKTEQWSFRWTLASLRMYQAGAFPKVPFYDTRMSDFFATVPTENVRGRRLQIDYLKRFAPDLARITWQAFGTDLYWQRHFHTWLLPWRAARKAARLLRGGPPPVERNWEVQFSGPGRERLRETLLAKGARLYELVEPRRIEALLDDFSRSPLEEGRGYTVSMLLTLSGWLEANA